MAGFTDIAIRNLKPGDVRREIPDPGASNLYLVIQPSGKKSFAVRYRYNGAPRSPLLEAIKKQAEQAVTVAMADKTKPMATPAPAPT